MKSVGKIVGILLLVLLLIVVGLGFALTQLIDPNDYKGEIQDLAREKANIELKLSGDIGWSLFPWLGLSLHQASVASTQTPDKPFAKLDMLGLSVRLLPLLSREVQMSAIRVEGLNLTLERNAQGKGNWEDIGPSANSSNQSASKEPTASQDKTAQPLKIDIDSLIINNGRLDYFDAQSGMRFSAESLQLTTGSIREGAAIPLKFSAFISANQPVLRVSTELSADFFIDSANRHYRLDNLRASGELSGEPFSDKSANFVAQGQLLFEQSAQLAKWNNLKLSLNQLRASGELSVGHLDKAPTIGGQLALAEFDLGQFAAGLGTQLPPMADASALKKFSLSGQIKGTKSSLALENLKIQLDDSQFSGQLSLADFSKQALRVQLAGDKLNLDRYLPPPEKTAAQTSKPDQGSGDTLPKSPTEASWSDEPVLPLKTLRSLDLALELTLEQLTYQQMPLNKVQLKANAADGLLGLQSLKAALYDGSLTANAQLDVRGVQPLLAASTKVVNVPIERLLEKPGQKSPISGALELNADVQSRGNSQLAWVQGLNGKANFVVKNGVLPDANLEQQLCTGIALLNRKTLSSEQRSQDTPFEQLSGSLNLVNGVATNPDLAIRIPGLSLKGNGQVNLPVLGMDYRLGLLIEGDTQADPDPACTVNRRYVGMELPVRCRGSLELGAKACRLDKDGVAQIAARLIVDQYGEKIESKLDKAIEKKLGTEAAPQIKDALRGLFKP
ncbi:cell envelope biogenesis protein AsmA [Ventosimonas gracilis]|uniref:Cell envelope biogenesis protein AsmA n=1 Tax=Ventosimonas gracilis TaxID=1680762 RepID=A0A139SPH9_9GAMM|nr:AsmA family protein [Ventosimonas gracilis]KXU36443.1 cell envelope biogenesis protein AsmA [Ventosimonas gracilis]